MVQPRIEEADFHRQKARDYRFGFFGFSMSSPGALGTLLMVLFFMAATVFSCYAQTPGELYRSARRAVAAGNRHSAFVYYTALVRDHPQSSVLPQAVFAVGEYDYLVGSYADAVTAFVAFLEEYPSSPAAVFALAYLYRIAEKTARPELVQNLKEKIVAYQRLCFLFKKCKEFRYRSPFLIRHKVAYYIDKVEFFADGELVAQIPY